MSFLTILPTYSRLRIAFLCFLVILTGIIHCVFLVGFVHFIFNGWNDNHLIVSLLGFCCVISNFLMGFVCNSEALNGLFYLVPGNLKKWLCLYVPLNVILSGKDLWLQMDGLHAISSYKDHLYMTIIPISM